MPQITSIVCTYRRPRLLARALASLAVQTVPPALIRVCDNSSGDETAAVVQWFKRRGLPIEYHCHPKNIGFEGNFTFAMSQENKTPFVHLLNDDDYVLERFFETALGGFKRVPQAVFVTARIAHVLPTGEVVGVPLARWRKEEFGAGKGAAYLIERGHPELTAMLYKSTWLRESGGFNFGDFGRACDVPFHVLAAAKYPIVACPKIGGVYSLHPEQLSALPSDEVQPIFGKMFGRLRAASFPNRADFKAVLRACAECHVYLHRHRYEPAGPRRELRGCVALAGLMASRPAHALDAAFGYLRSMHSVLSRTIRKPDEARAENTAVCAAATAEIAACLARLSRDYIDPCLTEMGLNNKA